MGDRQVDGCPEWCVRGSEGGLTAHRHVGEAVQLAVPEAGKVECTARLVSGDDGTGCEVLIGRWACPEPDLRFALEELDLILDAFDDGGRRVIQDLAGLVLRGTASLPRAGVAE